MNVCRYAKLIDNILRHNNKANTQIYANILRLITCVGNILNLLLHVILSLLNLSSGLNLAGCALLVGIPFSSIFLVE